MFGFLKKNPIPAHGERIWNLGLRGGAAARARMEEKREEVDVNVLGVVIWEFECLNILLTDRVVFQVMDGESRNTVMNRLIDWCIEDYVAKLGKGFSDDQKQNRRHLMNQQLRGATEGYGRCAKIIPEQGEREGGTMLYEFCHGVTNLIGHQLDPITHMHFMVTVTGDLGSLHPKDFAMAAKQYARFS